MRELAREKGEGAGRLAESNTGTLGGNRINLHAAQPRPARNLRGVALW